MLKLTNLKKIFLKGTVNEHLALDGLSLALEAGEFVTIIGSNGAGKSTLFNGICGNFLLDGGKVELGDRDITFLPEHKRSAIIGRLFQDPMKGTAPGMTIEENLAMAIGRQQRGALRLGVKKQDIQRFREELSVFGMGLEDRMKHKTGVLSGGQRQALSLLMATIAKPRLLLLDEHTAALDPSTAEKVMEITNTIIRREKLTAMMITHNIQSALTTGDRTVMIESGKILLDIGGAERAAMTIPELMAMYAGKTNKELDNDRMLLTR